MACRAYSGGPPVNAIEPVQDLVGHGFLFGRGGEGHVGVLGNSGMAAGALLGALLADRLLLGLAFGARIGLDLGLGVRVSFGFRFGIGLDLGLGFGVRLGLGFGRCFRLGFYIRVGLGLGRGVDLGRFGSGLGGGRGGSGRLGGGRCSGSRGFGGGGSGSSSVAWLSSARWLAQQACATFISQTRGEGEPWSPPRSENARVKLSWVRSSACSSVGTIVRQTLKTVFPW